jgi:voltage-gated potassium channel
MSRRGFGYAVALTVLVSLSGAAGIFALEREASPSFGSYADALWWTAMPMTTLGSAAWPQTSEGRLLCFFLALYAFAVFGYVTATLATFFIGRDAQNEEAEIPSAEAIAQLHAELHAA